jgi:hypothetical protein
MLKSVSLFALCLILLVLTQSVDAQGFQGAIAIGGNLSQVDGDEVVGFKKIGFNGSAIAILPIKEKWAISIEASFNQKGAYQKLPFEADPSKSLPYYRLQLNYAEVPLMLHFTDKEFLTFGLGLSYGRLVGVEEIEWGEQSAVALYSGDYLRTDLNGLVDIRFPIYKRLNFNFRYAYSFIPIRQRTFTNISGESWNRNQFNNMLTFRLYYIFNERKYLPND